ncbi:MAG: tetratricopeptide repeat protein [Ferruginibacter sp.]|nr:tetratricopeptide repeat protein [Cytophagales bacterium]
MAHCKGVLWLFSAFFSLVSAAQDRKLDSLLRALPSSKDTVKVNLLNQISKRYWYADSRKTLHYAREAIKLAQALNFGKGVSLAYNNVGISYYLQNDYDQAMQYFGKSVKLNQELGNSKGIGDAYNNMGLVYTKQSNYPKAVAYYLRSLKIDEQRGDERGVAGTLTNIGNIYDDQRDHATALRYYFRALKIGEKYPGEDGEPGMLLNNIGAANLNLRRYPEALTYLLQSLEARLAGDKTGIAISLSNVGLAYLGMKQYPRALDYFSRALPLQRALDDEFHLLATLEGLAETYQSTGDLKRSESYARQGLQMARKMNNKKRVASAYRLLAEVSKAQNKLAEAYQHQVNYSQTRDSILNDDNTRKIAQLQAGYETEKKQAEIGLLKKEKSLDRLVRNLFGIGLLSSLLVGALVWSRQRLKRRSEKALAEKSRQVLLAQHALAEAELAAGQREARQLQRELESRSKALTTHTLNLIQKNGIMEEIRETVSVALKSPRRDENTPLLGRLIKLIDYSFNLDQDWDEFKMYFEQVHQNFFVKLKAEHPDLNPGEMRLCALVRLNMNLKECATLLSVSPDSVKTARHRLRKKLRLSEEQNLVDYLLTI